MTAHCVEYAEHPGDVLARWLQWQQGGPAALCVVTGTQGGSVRAPGALMAVASSGDICGYVSGGCIDADLALQASAAMQDGAARQIRYGAGSPFIDLPLPCGGAIDILILPDPDPAPLSLACQRLAAREPVALSFGRDGAVALAPCDMGPQTGWQDERFHARYLPRLRLRIAGRGADALALARLAAAGGIETRLQLRDGEDARLAHAAGLGPVEHLQSPSALPATGDDEWTAFILMFHDGDWEVPLLRQALSGSAFHVGAVGSQRTQARRREALADAGLAAEQIARVNGPVGLVPSLRDASFLAASVLAEIIAAWKAKTMAPASGIRHENTALVLLAAGQSRRFAAGDKLLAMFRGQPLIAAAARRLATAPLAARLAIVRPGDHRRAGALLSAGWELHANREASAGLSSSIRCALSALTGRTDVTAALFILADMPLVEDSHLQAMLDMIGPGQPALFSQTDIATGPPALFRREVFPALMALSGDKGARGLADRLPGAARLRLPGLQGLDIDTIEDLETARESSND